MKGITGLLCTVTIIAWLNAGIVDAFSVLSPPSVSTRTKEESSSNLNFIEEAQNKFTEIRLSNYQKKGTKIASSFIPEKYESHPLFSNQHFQTIFGVFIRDSSGCAYVKKSNIISEAFPVVKAVVEAIPTILGITPGETECDYWDKRERFRTPDGDFFDVDYKFQNSETEGGGKGTVMIIHGLESNSNSSVCLNMARAYMAQGMDVACLNFRGCSGEPNDTMLQYHAGFTDDIIVFLDKFSGREKEKPLYITGFSLGANIVMKLLGDLGMGAVDKYNIRGAAVTAAPFDLNYHWRQLIDVEFNRIVYAGNLLKSMKKKVELITEKYLDGNKDTDAFDYHSAINAKNIPEIEDAMIAPLYGFKDKFDYYDKSASFPVMDYIAVPTYILNAADDPFFDPKVYPSEKDCSVNPDGAPIKFERTDQGGHLGHMFQWTDDDDGDDSNEKKKVASFAPMELARFLNHVHSSLY